MTMSTNITGSIPIGPIVSKSIDSQIHVSLPDAAATAEKSVGTGAHSVLARLGIVNGFLAYMIWIADRNSNIDYVTVDVGIGKVLSMHQVSTTDFIREAANMGPTMMMVPGMGLMMGPMMMMGDVMMNEPESYGHSFP